MKTKTRTIWKSWSSNWI